MSPEDLRRYLETAEQLRVATLELGQDNYKRRRVEVSRDYHSRITDEERGERESISAPSPSLKSF